MYRPEGGWHVEKGSSPTVPEGRRTMGTDRGSRAERKAAIPGNIGS